MGAQVRSKDAMTPSQLRRGAVGFSVATPVFNGMPHLPRCIGSVRGQVGMDTEHLVQDARSTDGSTEWLDAQADLDLVCEADEGMYDAVERAWSRSRGAVLSWLNSDEQYLPGALAKVEEVFCDRPEVDIVFGDAILVDPQGNLIAARREIPLRPSYVARTFLYSLSCTMFFRRSLLDAGDLAFEPGRRVAGDIALVLSLLEKGRKVHHLAEYLALFMIDGKNLSLSTVGEREREELRSGGRPAVALASAARRVEKAVRGCYRQGPLAYQWAEDDRPTYRQFTYERAPTRFDWARAGAGGLLPRT
jgi:hypothetical protein